MSDDAEHTVPADGDAERWLGRSGIAGIAGALQPGAYVARAYLYQRRHDGRVPVWARKDGDGQWRFDREYVLADARENGRTLAVTEAAKMLGATRRAVQTWVDTGLIVALDAVREEGASRRIDREAFMRNLPALRERLARVPAGGSPRAERGEAREAGERGEPGEAGEPSVPVEAREARETGEGGKRVAPAEDARRAAQVAADALAKGQAACERLRRELAEQARALRVLRKRSVAAARRLAGQERRQVKALALAQAREREAEAARRRREAAAAKAAAAAAVPTAGPSRGVAPVGVPVVGVGEPVEEARRARSAEAVAERFRQARAEQVQLQHWREEGARIAARVFADVEAGKMDRVDGAILFNDVARRAGIPDEVRIALMREHFKKGRLL